MRVLLFDTETTGLPKTRTINQDSLHLWPHIVQFSYLIYHVDENDITVMEDKIIQVGSDIEIPKESSDIHGITFDISQEQGVSIVDVLNGFFEALINTDILVAHNISFDVNMVTVELLRMIYYNKENVSPKILCLYKERLFSLCNHKNTYCTLKSSIDLCAIKVMGKNGREYNKFPKLIELHEKLFTTKPRNLHNSFNDMLATLRCYVMMTQQSDLLETSEKFKSVSAEIGLYTKFD